MSYHYYMFYKPFGCVTARRDIRFPVVMDYFRALSLEKLSPVGRLDRETEGLLLITDDGVFNQQMTNPAFHVPKTYEFLVLGSLDQEKLQRLSKGVLLTGSKLPTQGAKTEILSLHTLSQVLPFLHPDIQQKYARNLPAHPVTHGRITICEGRKRQIRRMMKAVGCCVIFLKRLSIGELALDPELKPGEWKELHMERKNDGLPF